MAESPQTASLHLKLGYAYEEVRKFDRAIAQWRLVLDLEPDHPQRIKLLNLVEKYSGSTKLTVAPNDKLKPEGPKASGKPEPKAVPKSEAKRSQQ